MYGDAEEEEQTNWTCQRLRTTPACISHIRRKMDDAGPFLHERRGQRCLSAAVFAPSSSVSRPTERHST